MSCREEGVGPRFGVSEPLSERFHRPLCLVKAGDDLFVPGAVAADPSPVFPLGKDRVAAGS